MTYKCKGCGSLGSIVEIEVVPRTHEIVPDPADPESFTYGDQDEAFWEGSTTLGYGCTNETCQYWQGQWGATLGNDSEDRELFQRAPGMAFGPSEIAEAVAS